MHRDETDQALIARVQRGEKQAFDLLVRKYQIKIAHLVARYVRNQGDVEDVVQETFIKAYRAIGRFRGDSQFYTWLYRIAVNTAKNYLVAAGRRPPGQDIDAVDAVQSHAGHPLRETNTPEASLRRDQLAARIRQAIDALPPELREAIILRELEGMNYEEIALAMECPIGTVRSRIFRAREAIEKEIRPLLD